MKQGSLSNCQHVDMAASVVLLAFSMVTVCNEQTVLAGHSMKFQPAMYQQAWTTMCNLVLIGDLLASEASGVDELSIDGQQLKNSLQASECTVQEALDHVC